MITLASETIVSHSTYLHCESFMKVHVAYIASANRRVRQTNLSIEVGTYEKGRLGGLQVTRKEVTDHQDRPDHHYRG